ncbi:uncharacterized protein LOC141599785 isoform X3 [Silene latifolia]|uniref:uncharacterized protein LOC141599785 isoform X3 n=1 Tax=Silene latifolia TaxID=37657 RepID=UPI003D7711B0
MATRIDMDNNPIKTTTVCIISRGSHLLLSMITVIKHASRLEGLIKIAELVMLLWCIGGIRGGCIPMKEVEPMSMEHDWLALQETKEESEAIFRL